MIRFEPVPHPIVVSTKKITDMIAERLNERIGGILVDVEYSLDGPQMEITTDKDPFFMEHYINGTVMAVTYQNYEELLAQAVRESPVMRKT